MPVNDAEKWDARYRKGKHDNTSPATVLNLFKHLLPENGTALDMACGSGANALLLSEKGLETSAWDISTVALEKLTSRAEATGLKINTEQRDVLTSPPLPSSFNVIVVSHFLERGLFPDIINALKDGGLLFYQTFIQDKCDNSGPDNPDYRLAVNELLVLCQTLRIIYYHEEGTIGDSSQGFRNEAMLVGQKVWSYVDD